LNTRGAALAGIWRRRKIGQDGCALTPCKNQIPISRTGFRQRRELLRAGLVPRGRRGCRHHVRLLHVSPGRRQGEGAEAGHTAAAHGAAGPTANAGAINARHASCDTACATGRPEANGRRLRRRAKARAVESVQPETALGILGAHRAGSAPSWPARAAELKARGHQLQERNRLAARAVTHGQRAMSIFWTHGFVLLRLLPTTISWYPREVAQKWFGANLWFRTWPTNAGPQLAPYLLKTNEGQGESDGY